MSNVNYDLKKRGVRMISSEEAWVKTKSSDKKKFAYIDDVCKLSAASKRQLVRHFYDDEG